MMLPTQSQKRLLKPPIRAHFTKPKIYSSIIKKWCWNPFVYSSFAGYKNVIHKKRESLCWRFEK